MFAAAGGGHHECAEVLLRAGTDVNWQNAERMTALHFAVMYGSLACMRVLVDRGADPTLRNREGLVEGLIPGDLIWEYTRVGKRKEISGILGRFRRPVPRATHVREM